MAAPDRTDRPSLLLVDDDAALTDTLSRALGERGFEIRTAATETMALELARERPPQYAVVGLHLPDRLGLALVSTLLEHDPGMQIVVLTAYGNIATAVEAIKLGAAYYMCKPASADELVAAFSRDAARDDALPADRPMSVKRLEWEYIWKVVREHDGNVSQAARALSMHRRTLQRKLAKRPVRM
jgi:two-component system response regulator RegA